MENNVSNGVMFMVIGMSVVFSFLALLVITVNVMKLIVGVLDKRLPKTADAAQSGAAHQNESKEIAAAIAAAHFAKHK